MWQALKYTHDSSGRVLYESTTCVAAMLCRVTSGLNALLSPASGQENVGGAASVEGQIMAQIIMQAKALNTAENLCSCLKAIGASLISSTCTVAPVSGEACKGLWSLIDGLNLATGKLDQRHGFPLAVVRGYAEPWADDSRMDALEKTDDGSSAVVELVTDCLEKSRGLQVAICYALLHGSDFALASALQVFPSLLLTTLQWSSSNNMFCIDGHLSSSISGRLGLNIL